MTTGIPGGDGADNNSALGQYDDGGFDAAIVEPMCPAQLGDEDTYCDLPVGHSGDHSALIEVRAHWRG